MPGHASAPSAKRWGCGAAPHGPRLPRVPMATGVSTNVKIVQRLLGHPRVVKTLDRLRHLHSHRLAAQRVS